MERESSRDGDSCSSNCEEEMGESLPRNVLVGWQKDSKTRLIKAYFSPEQEIKEGDIKDLLNTQQILREKANADENQKFAKHMIENGLLEITKRFIEEPLEKIISGSNYKKTKGLLTIIQNCSPFSLEMCRAVTEKSLHSAISECLRRDSSIGLINVAASTSTNEKASKIVQEMLAIMYNSLLPIPENQAKFREVGFDEICIQYTKVANPVIKTLALFVLTFTADISADQKQIETTSSNISFIFSTLLEPAIKLGKSLSGGHIAFSLREILEVLFLLATNSKNAKKMIKQGMLGLSGRILRKKTSPNDLVLCLNILWEISLSKGLRSHIKKHPEVVKEVEKMTSNADQEVKKIASSIQWNLEKLDAIKPCSDKTQASEGKHIMISYSWDQKEIIKLLVDKLNIAEKRIWLDTKNMQGNVIDTLCQAIKDASHVICCVSESYFKSTWCRQEAVYANAMKKKMIFVRVQQDYVPRDWLQFIMSDHYYYTMTCPEEVEGDFPKLLNFIENGSRPVNESETNENQPLEASSSKSESSAKKRTPESNPTSSLPSRSAPKKKEDQASSSEKGRRPASAEKQPSQKDAIKKESETITVKVAISKETQAAARPPMATGSRRRITALDQEEESTCLEPAKKRGKPS